MVSAINAWHLGKQYMADNEERIADYAQMFEELAMPEESTRN